MNNKMLPLFLILLGGFRMTNAQTNHVYDFGKEVPRPETPVYCNIFPICYHNAQDCDMELSPELKITNVTHNQNPVYKGKNRTIKAGEIVCWGPEDFIFSGTGIDPFVPLPTSFISNLPYDLPSDCQITFAAKIKGDLDEIIFNPGNLLITDTWDNPQKNPYGYEQHRNLCKSQLSYTTIWQNGSCPLLYQINTYLQQ